MQVDFWRHASAACLFLFCLAGSYVGHVSNLEADRFRVTILLDRRLAPISPLRAFSALLRPANIRCRAQKIAKANALDGTKSSPSWDGARWALCTKPAIQRLIEWSPSRPFLWQGSRRKRKKSIASDFFRKPRQPAASRIRESLRFSTWAKSPTPALPTS